MPETTLSSEVPIKRDSKNVHEALDKERVTILSELGFVILPFLIILIVNGIKGDFVKTLQTPDWALAAAILYGQTIVKVVMGVAAQRRSCPSEYFGLIISMIIVFGLGPSLVVLTLSLINPDLFVFLIVIQFVEFFLAAATFWIFGSIGQMLSNTAFKNRIADLLNKE